MINIIIALVKQFTIYVTTTTSDNDILLKIDNHIYIYIY
jgi:hypothetical protein